MEFYEIKRGKSDEEQEEDQLMRDPEFEGNPSYYSSSPYNSTNNHQSRPFFAASWGEDISRSYHGAASVAASRIQELDLMDSVAPPPPPPSVSTIDKSHQIVGSSSTDGGGDGNNSTSFCTSEKEHMFHKVVTPSDVGKLNRLVIPKQHAEKYFPLDEEQMKGLLLNFEDRNGKEWRFRYSYWNSSQSYVMTKGWSRFVKDKKLDAGDIVLFDRGVGDSGKDRRLFIDWRHRTVPNTSHHIINPPPPGIQWGQILYPMPPSMLRPDHYGYNHQNQWNSCSSSSTNNMNLVQLGGTTVINSVPVMHNNGVAPVATPKRLRLFGVNMDCSSTPQEYSEGVVLPSVPLRFVTPESTRSVGVNPLSQPRHFDGFGKPSDSRGRWYRR